MKKCVAAISGAVLALAAGSAALADDTEIFFNQSATAIPANIMFILDTSGSMSDLVTTWVAYDPAKTYTANSCASLDNTAYYFSGGGGGGGGGGGTPRCGSTNKLPKTLFQCNSMLANMGITGYVTDVFAQWGTRTNSNTTTDATTGATTTTSTQTYGWQRSLNSSNTTGYVECKGDAGKTGLGADATMPYASTDTWSVVTTTLTPPGTVTTSGSVSGSQLTGVWDASSAKNYFSRNGGTNSIYSSNYMNYLFDSTQSTSRTKMAIMHDAASALLASLSGVNIGLMRYDLNGNGGMVLAPIADISTGTNRQDRINLINSWAPSGSTPLSETQYESYLYFSGNKVNFGNNSTTSTCSAWNATGQCNSYTKTAAPSVASSRTGGLVTSSNYDSPADYSCRQNFLVYLTDGLPNEKGQADAAIQALPQFATLGGQCDTKSFSGATGGKCTAALAQYMYTADMRPDIPSVQNVTSYFIGFGADFANSSGTPTQAFNYLNAAAIRGGGKAYTATNLTELTDAFNSILVSVLDVNTTFSAPSVAVNAFNRTQTLNDLYVSVFKPAAKFHWPGNVKKFKLSSGLIVDSNGNPAVDSSTGFFRDTSSSYWSHGLVDGAAVPQGGVAGNLPLATARTVYTFLGANPPAGSPVALTAFNATTVTATDLAIGNPGDPSLTELVNWARGQDTRDAVAPAGTADQRNQMGDPIHTQPVAIIYGKNANGTDDTVVYTPTNDGYFHAVDASVNPDGTDTATSGNELWSFIPKQMLAHLKDLYFDNPAPVKHYGLDGSVTVLKYDVNGDGTISGNDKVILIFGTGRNADTSAYYALDVTSKLAPKFMWKIDAATLPGLGQAWSPAVITRVNISGAPQNTQKLVAVIGGGYDASEDNRVYNATDGVGNHIYMVDVISGALLWSVGSSGSTLNLAAAGRAMDHAIPSAVSVVDINGNGYADRLYAGDMAARIWRFDITNGNPAATLVAGGQIASLGTSLDAVHLPADVRRFYGAVDVSAEQKVGVQPFLNLAIGSGYRGHPLDLTAHDRFYSVRDYYGFTNQTQAWFNSVPLVRDALSGAAASTLLTDITTVANPVMPAGAMGWQIDLNTHPDWSSGEKVLVPSRTFNSQVIFTTYQPTSTVITDPCANVGNGTNRVYVVDVMNGAATIDRNNDGTITADERSQDLRQTGIAPETAFLFPPSSGGSGGNASSGGGGTVICLSGAEVLGVCNNFNQRVKTYWREGMSN